MVELKYGLFDVTAADDSTQTCTDVQPFADVTVLNTPDLDSLSVKPWATLETNQWLLDGSKRVFPDEPEKEIFGLWSLSQSGDDCNFAAPITLICDFTEPHTTVGITFIFREDSYEYANKVKIEYYSSNGIEEKIFHPDRPTFFASGLAENYTKIVCTFYGTSLPNRYLKLTEIKFGAVKIFDDDSVISAQILEEIDPTGAELSINTLEFTAYTTDFALLDPNGVYAALQQRQAIGTKVDGSDFGTFFLDEPESEDDDTTTFKCIDFVGVIDTTTFMGGIYSNKLVGELVTEIMTSAEMLSSEYSLDSSLSTKRVSGYIPICTHREALQQVAFAIGAIVDCSRGKAIKIYTQSTVAKGTITHDDKFDGHKVKMTSLVTGVEVTAHRYTLSSEASSAYEDTLTAGTHTVTFGSPFAQLTASGATIIASGANYAIISVPSTGTVTITGKEYEDNTSVVGVYASELPANAKPNVILCDENATLVSSANALEIAQRLYSFYQKRYEDEGDMILGTQKVGETWRMNSLNNRDIVGTIQSLDINLITGVASAKITGEATAREET